MSVFPEVKTSRLHLRNFHDTDLDSLHDLVSNDASIEHYDKPDLNEKSHTKEVLKKCIFQNTHSLEYGGRWAIVLKSDPSKLIGSCGYHNINRKNCSLEIGYELHPNLWNNGYALEAVSAIITFCFNNNFPFFLNMISATTSVSSTRSISLLKKLGFSNEGTFREYSFLNSHTHDIHLFSLLRRNFFENLNNN